MDMILSSVRPSPSDNCCECCGLPPELFDVRTLRIVRSGYSGPLCRDHDHATGLFRGWICARCNKQAWRYDTGRTVEPHIFDYINQVVACA